MKVQKRDGRIAVYDANKIRAAIRRANETVEESEQADAGLVEQTIRCVEEQAEDVIPVDTIRDLVERQMMGHNKYMLAKKYMLYRYQRALLQKTNTTDESILKLIRNENKELAEENSNKNTVLASTQRDYIAGEVSRDVTKRLLLSEKITLAHENGVLHFHDADYFIQPIFNCCLIDIADMPTPAPWVNILANESFGMIVGILDAIMLFPVRRAVCGSQASRKVSAPESREI